MLLTQNEISEEIKKGAIRAISLDTSIFDQYRLGLEHGLLRRLKQFKGSKVEVILADIVQREVQAHLKRDAEESQSAVKKAFKFVCESWQVSKTEDQILNLLFGNDTAESVSKRRYDAYTQMIGAQMADSNRINVNELLNRYFDERPPFAVESNKKHEFPDAIALLALESFAQEKSTKMLVVTTDKDWHEYCKDSTALIAISDLGAALRCFQDESAQYACSLLAEEIRNGDANGWVDNIRTEIEDQIWNIDFTADVFSNYNVDEEVVDVIVDSMSIEGIEDGTAFEPIEYDQDGLVTEVRVNLHLQIEFHFKFYLWDSVDREYVGVDSRSITVPADVEIDVLVTFKMGEIYNRLPDDVDLSEVEIRPEYIEVEVGQVEPDFGPPDD